MAMVRIPQDFREFLQSLLDNEVEYLLIGGYAVGYHGYPRATVDLDVWVNRSEDNAERITKALREFGFDSPKLSPDLFSQPGQIIRMGLPPTRLKILTSIDGVEFETCYRAKIETSLDGVQVKIIDRENLLRNKAASGRHKDLADLEHLKKTNPSQ